VSTLRDQTASTADEHTPADDLRDAMVTELRQMEAVESDQVADALRTVPRHLFAPGEPWETAYAANSPIVTKRDERGRATSSLSATHIQATMLEQAQLQPGMRVLEIGSGGYNAALIAELVGTSGQVTSVDIDPDIVDRARDCLDAAGYQRVHVVLADAEAGVADHAPFDRIIVTAGAWDIPPAWIDQLVERGRIVVPLRLCGLTRSIAFEREGDQLVSLNYRLCGFVPMQGAGAHSERVIPLEGDDVGLRLDGNPPVDAEGLRHALSAPRVERWSGVVFDQPDELELWLGTAPGVLGLLMATQDPIDRGLVGPSAIRGVPTLVRDGSFAYRTKRGIDGTEDFELGVYAHGPRAEAVAEEYVELLRTWDRDHRRGPQARIEVCPAGSPATGLAQGRVFEKKHTRIAISWP
jgi:protein-L-isoaspartate(D-aspartate) O-methyltransferase